MGVYAIRESLADEILNDLSHDEDYAPTDDAKDTIISAIYATFEEKYGEDFAEVATDFGQDIDDIAGRATMRITGTLRGSMRSGSIPSIP